MRKSPLAIVKDKFKDKDALVAAVKDLAKDELFLGRLNEDKGLAHVSNKKLLHLHAVLTAVKEEHGSRDKLIAAIVGLEKRAKDDGFKARLEKQPTPKLYAAYKVLKKKAA